jgi:SHS2 domain-containing protein
MYETFAHTADIGLSVQAAQLSDLFADAAKGLFSILVENPEDVRPVREVDFEIAGEQTDFLLFDWLNELLYRFETERLLFCEFHPTISEAGLTARALGEAADENRHRLAHEVKAVTYHQLAVERTSSGWEARVIFDI